jgi:hypothetical protein
VSRRSVFARRCSRDTAMLDCDVCPLKMKCCPNTSARHVPRDLQEDARDVARRLMGTKRFLKSRDERKCVEMRFAHLKIHHGFERMRLRGLSGARDEFHLAAIVQNLKRSVPSGHPLHPSSRQQRENPRTDQVTATAGTGSKSHPQCNPRHPPTKRRLFRQHRTHSVNLYLAARRRSRCPRVDTAWRETHCRGNSVWGRSRCLTCRVPIRPTDTKAFGNLPAEDSMIMVRLCGFSIIVFFTMDPPLLGWKS